jgi:hypothetical protein
MNIDESSKGRDRGVAVKAQRPACATKLHG